MLLKYLITILFLLATSGNAAEFSVVRKYVHPLVVTPSNNQLIMASGSAITIRDGYVLTAAHVVQVSASQRIYVGSPVFKRGKVEKIDLINDLALVSTQIHCPCATLTTGAAEIDQRAYGVGYPMFSDYRIQILTVGLIQGMSGNHMISTTSTAPGGSGGALFIQEGEDYRLAGLIKGVAANGIGPSMLQINQLYTWFVFSTPSSVIKKFLDGTPAAIK